MRIFKICPITKKIHQDRGIGKRCRLCEAKRMRKFSKTKAGKAVAKRRALTQRGTLAKHAYNRVCKAIRYHGHPRATDFNCVDCGTGAQVYDHRDYTKPMDIDPVCKVCNSKRGRGKNNFYTPEDFDVIL